MRTRDWAAIDFYAVLGVEPTAPVGDIAGAFRVLAKQLHPDRPGSNADDADRFTTIVAAYEVLGNDRLRRAYDDVRAQTGAARAFVGGPTTTAPAPASGAVPHTPPVPARPDPRRARRTARRWLGAGVAVLLAGVVVSVVIVRLEARDHARRAGRLRADAVIVGGSGRPEVRFTTAAGTTVQVREPNRIDPGTDAAGTRLTVLYRPDRPRDVIVDESTAARDITLWIVALKLLVGGGVFVAVGARRLRRLGPVTPA